MARLTRGRAPLAAIVGGAIWAVTPLRQQVVGSGGDPRDGQVTFRLYNLLIVVIAVLLFIALRELRNRWPHPVPRWLDIGWSTVVVGTLAMLFMSLPAVVLGGAARGVVIATQDLGFFAAVLASMGAVLMGAVGLRRGLLPTVAGWLFVLAFPLGLLLTIALAGTSLPEDVAGLPLTLLYGGAFVALGLAWWARDRRPEGAGVS